MAITITGAKYSAASISSVGTTTVTVSAATFTSGDFAVARRIDLYNSAGTTFKGMAFVRQFVSTTSLEMETTFFDPKTGSAVTQVVGDTVYISKNWADVAQTNITVSNNLVTINDTITFGTASTINSLCFHDENVLVVNVLNIGSIHCYDVAGGFLSFGHLQDYTNKVTYNGCNFSFNNTNSCNSFVPTSTAARLLMFGCTHRGQGGAPCYFASGYDGAVYGTDWAYIWCLNSNFENSDVLSLNAGGAWTTGTDHVLENCSYVGAGSNQILVRFGNGQSLGGTYKILRNSSAPISIFGADAAGTYAIGAPAGKRAVVQDMGTSNALWRSASATNVQTVNITNLISTDYRLGLGLTPESVALTTGTKYIYFKDTYTNLQNASVLGIIQNSSWTLDDSGTSSGAGSSVSLQAFQSTATGLSVGTSRDPWTARIRKYGYDEQEIAVTLANYSLGTAGTAYNVAFGGSIIQVVNPVLSIAQATALAYTGITVTDHGASPVTWNSKQFSITVTVNLSTAPGRTAAQLFAHVKASTASLSSWNGKIGLLWHVLLDQDSNGNYITNRGVSGGAGATLKGVRVIDQLGNPFIGFTTMTADDGTLYTVPTTATITISGCTAGSRIQLYNTTGSVELYNGTPSFPFTYSETYASDKAIRLRVTYVTSTTANTYVSTNIGSITSTALNLTYLVSPTTDTIYVANAVDGSAMTEFSISGTTLLLNVTATTTLQRMYAFMTYWLFTSGGIRDQYQQMTATDQTNYVYSTTYGSFKFKNTSASPIAITGGNVKPASGAVASIVDSTGSSVICIEGTVVSFVTGSGLSTAEHNQLFALSAAI